MYCSTDWLASSNQKDSYYEGDKAKERNAIEVRRAGV
jgi:hypothetical protein